MAKHILQELPELVKAEVISEEVANQIRNYYRNKSGKPANVLFIIFGVLGALLTGLGLILILAHNWDELNRSTKTILAFVPLLTAQLLCMYTLIRQADNTGWQESAATFLFMAVGASIFLVSQIYHIPGNGGSFVLTWMLLCLPLIYFVRASAVSLLYITGITYYAADSTYFNNTAAPPYFYWLLLLGIFPHYYQLLRRKAESNFTIFHHWLVPLSVLIALGTVALENPEFLFISYISLFNLFYLLGQLPALAKQKRRNNGYLILGALGTIGLLLTLSFDFFWNELQNEIFPFRGILLAPEFISAFILSAMVLSLLIARYRDYPPWAIRPIEVVFLLFILIFITGLFFSLPAIMMVNLLLLIIGISTTRTGARLGHLGVLNYGLLIIAALVICRFFDTDLTFIARGLLFILVGLGFFFSNYWMLQKRKNNEK